MMINSLSCVDANHSFFVYKLINPITSIVCYIGITKNPKERLRKHISSKTITLKNNWIKSLKSKGLAPEMVLIDSANSRDEVNIKEKYWILTYKEWGCNLKNMTDGGDGGDTFSGQKHTQETKDKISKANKGRKRDLSYLKAYKERVVEQLSIIDGSVINVFNSVKEASLITGASKTNISKFANGTIKSTIKKVGGYAWRYKN